MNGREARFARNARYRCSFVELLEDRALPSVLSPINPTRIATPRRFQDASEVSPAAVVPETGRDGIEGTRSRVPLKASGSDLNVSARFQDSPPAEDADPEGSTPPSPVPSGSGFSAVISEELDISDGAGLDAEDSSNPVGWSLSDPRGEGSLTPDGPGLASSPAGRTGPGRPGPGFTRGMIWLYTAAIVHPNGPTRGFGVTGDGDVGSRMRPRDPRVASIGAAAEGPAPAHPGPSSGWAELLVGAGSPDWERLDRDLRHFLSGRFGVDPAATDAGDEPPVWTSWLAVLTTMLAAARVVRASGWGFRRGPAWADPAGPNRDPSPISPGPWPLGPL